MAIQFKRISIIIFALVLVLAMCLTFTVFTKDLFGDYESGSKTYSAQGLPVSGNDLNFIFWFFAICF